MMRSRALREGAVGLLIIGGLLSFGGFLFWIYNLRLGVQRYSFTILYDQVSGLDTGSSVRLRGVTIGRVEQIVPGADTVRVDVEIDGLTAIPRSAFFSTSQTGLVGQTVVDIFPAPNTPPIDPSIPAPIASNCDSQTIVCAGDSIEGVAGVDFASVLVSFDELSQRINNDEFFDNLNQTLEGVTEVSDRVASLSSTLESKLSALNTESLDLGQISAAATSVQSAADELTNLLADNRNRLSTSLDNIEAMTVSFRNISASLEPILTDPTIPNELRAIPSDLRTFLAEATLAAERASMAADNAVVITDDVRQLSSELGDPGTLATLRQTLDSARSTFENAQKITADIDELTGDPTFRTNLRNLITGLGQLVSSNPSPAQNGEVAPAMYHPEDPNSSLTATQSSPLTVTFSPGPEWMKLAPEDALYFH